MRGSSVQMRVKNYYQLPEIKETAMKSNKNKGKELDLKV